MAEVHACELIVNKMEVALSGQSIICIAQFWQGPMDRLLHHGTCMEMIFNQHIN